MGDPTMCYEPFAACLADCPRLLMFTGKGGVGKTTCSALAAIAFAECGLDTLVFSTDPAHSLADSLGVRLGPGLAPVAGVAHLWGLEIDAAAALAGWKQRFGEGMAELLTSASYLDDEDVAALLDLELPGLDELMGLQQIIELLAAEPPRFRHLVWDSAPTGHTLRLLELPALIDHWVRALAGIQWKYRELPFPVGPAAQPDESDLLLTLKRTIRQCQELMRDPRRTRLVPVTTPEPMAGAETVRLLRRLRSLQIPVQFVVINGVHPDRPECAFCSKRHRWMQEYLRQLGRNLAPLRLIALPASADAVYGVERLRRLAQAAPGP